MRDHRNSCRPTSPSNGRAAGPSRGSPANGAVEQVSSETSTGNASTVGHPAAAVRAAAGSLAGHEASATVTDGVSGAPAPAGSADASDAAPTSSTAAPATDVTHLRTRTIHPPNVTVRIRSSRTVAVAWCARAC
ncbi:exported hypothetical protein [Frankia sp. AgKG'84/4]